MVQVSLTGPKTPASKLLAENVEADQNIAVFVRCRPMKASDKKNVVEVIPEQKSIRVNDRGNSASSLGNDKLYSRMFSFDSVFGPATQQIEVYKSVVAPLIEQVIAGYNCTVFAYGQTGTGKTYTMEGERTGEEFSWEDDPLSGMIPRALHQLFETLPENMEHTIGVSFIELYNEELYDLLSPVDDTARLKIYDDPVKKGSVIISGLEEINVHTKAQIYEILRKGSEKRQTATTLLNACSSRSHTIFSVTVHIKENSIDGEELLKIGKLNLVDLAGSENIGRSGASEKRAREAGNINQSLLTLGRVITSLTEKAPHIPYRESKLTRLLKDSLGGRTKTSIIATISPNVVDAEDTLSTLEYAQRAKKITNKPEVNQKLSKKTLLREYTAEIERLRRDLMACREKNGFYISEANYNELLEKNDAQAKEIQQREAELAALQEDLERMTALFGETSKELEEKQTQLADTTETLKTTEENLKVTEINLKEQTYLLDVHSKNEETLYSQAQELLKFADISSKHLSNLHRKVDCQKNIEENNFSKIQLFQENFNAQMEHFLHLLDIGTESMSECLSTIKPQINSGFSVLGDNVNEIIQSLNSTKKTMENAGNDFESAFESDTFSAEKVASNKDIILALDESRSLYEKKLRYELASTRIIFEEGLKKVSETISLQRSEVETLLMKQSEHMSAFVDFRKLCLDNIRTVMNNYFEAHNSQIGALIKEVETLKMSMKESSKTKAAKMSQIGQLLVELSECEKKSVAVTDGNIENVVSLVGDMLKCTDKERVDALNVVDETSEKFETHEKIGFELINNVDCLNSQNIQTNITGIDSVVVESKPRFEIIQKVLSDMSEDIHCNVDESAKLSEEIVEAMECNLHHKRSILGELKNDTDKSILTGSNMSEMTLSNITKTKESILRSVEMSVSEAKNWSRSYKRELKSRSSDFDLFKSSDLARYIPTGTTPQKSEANYPQQLTITSPNTKLLSRYRKMMDEKCAAEVPLPDSDDIVADVLSQDFTDSANIENKSPLITGVKSHEETKIFSDQKKVKKGEKLNITRKPLNQAN